MTRKRTGNSSSSRGRVKSHTTRNALIGLAAIAIAVYLILILLPDSPSFSRASLDSYVELTKQENKLRDGASVYFDMSDGMNCAYNEILHQKIQQAIIDKLAANDAVDFFSLADGIITPVTMSHTELYNYMMSAANFQHQRAPIEKTLDLIVEKKQPALLITDFEEYKGSVIERAAYAKRDFIKWLACGFNITFYKWDFCEKNKLKHMFLAVFDDNGNRLNSLVNNAIKNVCPQIETFVLGSREFSYPTSSKYLSLKQGGNYHNSKGQDIVTAVLEDGSSEGYISYAKPYATANGDFGNFTRLNQLVGSFSEYYPIGIEWTNAISNSKIMQQDGIAADDLYTHLLSNLYVNFAAQDGFDIKDVEVRVFDMQNTIEEMQNNLSVSALDSIEKKEIFEIFKASMVLDEFENESWNKISVDFHDKFNGIFPPEVQPDDLLKANIVISNAEPINKNKIEKFFGWLDNFSLAKSVQETLSASSSNPEGRVLFSYYIKSLAY